MGGGPPGLADGLRAEIIEALVSAKLMISDLLDAAHSVPGVTPPSVTEMRTVAVIGNQAAALIAHTERPWWDHLRATVSPEHRRRLDGMLFEGRARLYAVNRRAAIAVGIEPPALPREAAKSGHTRQPLPRIKARTVLLALLPLVAAFVFAVTWLTSTTTTTISLYSDRGETWDVTVSCGERSAPLDEPAAAAAVLSALRAEVGDLNGRLISLDPGGPGLDGALSSLKDRIGAQCGPDKDSAGGPVILAVIAGLALTATIVIRSRVQTSRRRATPVAP